MPDHDTPDLDALFEPGWLTRCDWCGWKLVDAVRGCSEGNCSMRPMPSNADTPRKVTVRALLRAARERDELRTDLARAHVATEQLDEAVAALDEAEVESLHRLVTTFGWTCNGRISGLLSRAIAELRAARAELARRDAELPSPEAIEAAKDALESLAAEVERLTKELDEAIAARETFAWTATQEMIAKAAAHDGLQARLAEVERLVRERCERRP